MSKLIILLSLTLAGLNAFANECQLEVEELTRQEQSYSKQCATFEEGKLQAACLMNHEAMVSFRDQKAATCVGTVAPEKKDIDLLGLRARLWREFMNYMHAR